jgi:hypothetical protein
MAKKTSWAVIIVGISAFLLVVGAGLVGVVGYVIYQEFAPQAKSATEVSADEEFAKILAKFEGREPYLVIKDGEPVVSETPAASPGKPVEALHIIVWDPDEQKVIKLNMPFWLLRMAKDQPIKISANDEPGEAMKLKITVADLERRGPGLVLDHKEATGQRVLVWAQ